MEARHPVLQSAVVGVKPPLSHATRAGMYDLVRDPAGARKRRIDCRAIDTEHELFLKQRP